jgi:predicted protein tyrosine phosphatase
MSLVVVCPLSKVSATVDRLGASHLVSLIDVETLVERPDSILPEHHLYLGIHDITEPVDGLILPDEEHVRELIEFVEQWDRKQPMVVHCYAGISRSTAAAFIALCVARPDRDEREIARALRSAASFASPNPRLIALADSLLGRDGRMVRAIAEIGRGELAFEGEPFALRLEGDDD